MTRRGGYPIGGGVFSGDRDGLGQRRRLLGGRLHAAARASASCARPAPTTRTGCAATARCSCRRARGWTRRSTPARPRHSPGLGRRRAAARGEQFGADPEKAGSLLRHSGLARVWGLARELKAEPTRRTSTSRRSSATSTPASPTPRRPPPESETLDGFLFDAKIGFCQQFSGAEALLLRMGGVPARVATGFTTGSFDENEKEYVVRDLDAHSWVEVWFPGYGWVHPRPDARRGAGARASRATGAASATAGALARAPTLGGERLSDLDEDRWPAPDDGDWHADLDRRRRRARRGRGRAAACFERRRRKRRPPPAQRPMAEFERALRARPLRRGDGRHADGHGAALRAAGRARPATSARCASSATRAARRRRRAEQRRGLRAALARDAGLLPRLVGAAAAMAVDE